MATYYTLLTPAGLAKVTNAQLTNTKLEISHAAVGDANGTPYSPTGNETALRREVWRGGIVSIEVDAQNPNWIVVEAVIPATSGGFSIREVGLFDVTGTLIAIGNYPDTYKPLAADGSTMDLALRTIIEVNNAESVTLRIDPNVIVASRTYVDTQVEKFSMDVDKKLANITVSDIKRVKSSAAVVFTSDDGGIGDYINLRPIHQATNVPLTIGLVSTKIGLSGYMNIGQLNEVVGLGWEIASHSETHPENPFMPERPTDFVENEYGRSKKTLEDLGFKVESFLTPNGQYSARERMISKKYYRSARVSDPGKDGLNHAPIETAELKTIWLDQTYGQSNFEYYKDHIDRANETGALLIISTHGNLVTTNGYKALYRQVVEYATSNSRTMTLSKALDEFENLVEIGDFTKAGSGNRAPVGEHFVVGRDGTTYGTYNYVKPSSEVGLESSVDDFAIGITYVPVLAVDATNAPEGFGGVMITCKMHSGDFNNYYGYTYQEYQIFNSNRIYRRFLKADKTWGVWEVKDVLRVQNTDERDLLSTFGAFRKGITHTPISGAKAQATGAPVGVGGVLTTYKFVDTTINSQYGFNRQEYRPFTANVTYTRYLKSDGTWDTWKSLGVNILNNVDVQGLSTPFSGFEMGITYTPVSVAQAASSPGGLGGLLVTHKVINTELHAYYGYNYQEYRRFNSIIRHVRYLRADSTWGEWLDL